MKNFLYLIWISLITVSLNLNGNIIEIKHFSELPKYVNEPKTLVILDIDNTISEPTNEVGSDQWFSACIKKEIDAQLDKIEAINKVLPSYFAAQKKAKVKPVETETVKIIQSLQKQKFPVLGLTARSLPLIDCTHKQLKSINVDLSRSSLSKKDITFSDYPFPTKYQKGIIFCGNNNKGQILKKYLDLISFQPSKIIFVDDKKSNLETVEKEFKNSRISFIGLRYSYLDEKVNNFTLKENPQNNSHYMSFFTKIKNKVSSLFNRPTQKNKASA